MSIFRTKAPKTQTSSTSVFGDGNALQHRTGNHNGNESPPTVASSNPLTGAPKTVTVQAADAPHNNGYSPPPEFRAVREAAQQFLVDELQSVTELQGTPEFTEMIEPVFTQALTDAGLVVSRVERQQMFGLLLAEITGFGPIQPLLDDDSITEVMVNGADLVFIERGGRVHLTDVKFLDDEHVFRVIERIVTPLGRRIDEASPMVDARLPDGSRVNAIIPPLSLIGPCLTIRKFRKDPLKVDDLIAFGAITPQVAEFAKAAVHSALNVIVSGGTGSGKTTLLNVLSAFIPDTDRIVTIEDAAELQLQQRHVIPLEKRPANSEGKGEVSIRDLMVNSLRMRPDRIVVGEVRSGEALDMLQAMNTGHDGSLTSVHSNGPRDTLNRIETMVLMSGIDLPLRAIRQQIASAVDLIVHVERMRDGSRKVVQVAEVLGLEGEIIVLQDIFKFDHQGIDANDQVLGQLVPTGLRPRVNDRILEMGIELPSEIFTP